MTHSNSAPRPLLAGRWSRPGPDAATWLGIYLVFLFAIPSRLVLAPLGSAGAVSTMAGLASFLMWIILWLASVDTRPLRPQPVHVALGVFLLAVGISYALAMTHPITPAEISPADVALISLASWSGTLLLAHDAIRSRARLDSLVWWTAISGGLMATLGIAQFLSHQAIVDMISIPGLTSIADAGNIVRNGLIRPAGTAIHPIEYGTLLSLLLPLTLHVGFHHGHRPFLLRWLPALAVGGIIAISSSRSAYVSAAIALAVCVVGWTRRQRVIVLGSLVAVFGLLTLAVPRLIRAITTLFVGVEGDPSIESRTDSYSFAWSFIVQHPLFGRGLGTLLPKYRIFDNQYLLLLVTVGVIGTLAFCGLALTAAVTLIMSRRRLRSPADRDLAISLTAAIVSGFSSLAFFDAFAFPMTMGALFLMLGLAGAFHRLSMDRDPEGGA